MNDVTAKQLRNRTLDEVRLRNDDAVLLLWQSNYHTPLIPSASVKANLRAEKLVERLGMLPLDAPDPRRRVGAAADLLGSLGDLGALADASTSANVGGATP